MPFADIGPYTTTLGVSWSVFHGTACTTRHIKVDSSEKGTFILPSSSVLTSNGVFPREDETLELHYRSYFWERFMRFDT